MVGKNRRRPGRKYTYNRRRSEHKGEEKETMSDLLSPPPDITLGDTAPTPEQDRCSSSSWISMDTLPNIDSYEFVPVEDVPSEPSMAELLAMPEWKWTPPTLKDTSMVFLSVVERSVQLLKTKHGAALMLIFQKLIDLAEGKHADNNVMCYMTRKFLENLETDNFDYLLYLQLHLEGIALPKELIDLYVSKDKVESHYVFLGDGAFGAVFRGQLNKNDKSTVTVAIKEVNHEQFNYSALDEAVVMAKLDHEVILKLLAVTIDGGRVKLILEHMENRDLVRAIIEGRLCLSPSDVLMIAHDVASGMEYLSDKQYVHRDLKCTNVFVNHKKECKIGDFGLCRYVGDSGGVYKDDKVRIEGTHVAPEAKHSNAFTVKSDVWAMGTFIWELYSTRKVFRNTKDILQCLYVVAQMWKMFTDLDHLVQVRDCPTELHKYIVEQILNKDPARRPSFREIKEKIIDVVKSINNNVILSVENVIS